MRFTAAAVAFLAGSAVAETANIVYSTAYETITSCAPTVTNCPARSTVVSSSIVALTPTGVVVPAPVPTGTGGTPGTGVNQGVPFSNGTNPSVNAVQPPTTGLFSQPADAAAACATQSVETITSAVTIVTSTVVYKTHDIPCTTAGGNVVPSGAVVPTGAGPVPTVPSVPQAAGAATLGGSAVLVAAALALLA